MSTEQPKDTRSADQIKADLEKTRQGLADTVNELAGRLSPKAGLESAKESVASMANDASRNVKEMTGDAAVAARGMMEDSKQQLAVFSDDLSMHAKTFVADVKRGDTKTLALAGATVAGIAGLVALAFKRN